MKTIKITNGTIVYGIGDVRPGTVLDVEDRVARQLFIAGKAVPWKLIPEPPAVRKDTPDILKRTSVKK